MRPEACESAKGPPEALRCWWCGKPIGREEGVFLRLARVVPVHREPCRRQIEDLGKDG